MILVEETQRLIKEVFQGRAIQNDLTALHTRINSILIHLGDHMAYIGQLLTSGNYAETHNIALDEEERGYIIRMSRNSSENYEVAQKASIRHTFQMLTPDDLCIIMKIPIKTPLRSVALVKAFSYPLISNKNTTRCAKPTPFVPSFERSLLC